MTATDNPLDRLYYLVKALSQLERNTNLLKAWAQVLGVNPNNRVRLFQALAEATHLFEQVQPLIDSLELGHRDYVPALKSLRALFASVDLTSQLGAYERSLTPLVLMALRSIADLYAKDHPGAVVGEQELTALRKEVQELLALVKATDLPPDLKSALIIKLKEMQRILLAYGIWGLDGLRELLYSTVGVLGFHQEEWESVKPTKQWATLERVLAFLGNLAQIVGLGVQLAQLVSGAPFRLGPGGS